MAAVVDSPIPKAREIPVASRPNLALLALCAAMFMAVMDAFIVNVALETIGNDLGKESLSNLSWIITGYAIFYGALLVPAGRLADRFGRKATFQAGLFIFAAASAGCALSPNLWWLVGFRCIQALGAAVLTPTSLGLLLTALPADRRGGAVKIWSASSALAGVAGPVIGGLLIGLSWRWIFLINVPIWALTAGLAAAFIPRGHKAPEPLPDLAGAVLLIISVVALALGLVKGPEWGWIKTPTLAAGAVFAVGLVAFILRSRNHHNPILDAHLLDSPGFIISISALTVYSIGFAIELLSIVLYFERVLGWSALKTGIAIAPSPLMVPIFASVAHRLSKFMKAGTISAIGSVATAVGPLLMIWGAMHGSYAALLPGWLLIGVGVGLAVPTLMGAGTKGLPAHRASTGSGVLNMARQIGSVFGTAALVVVLGPAIDAGAFTIAWWISAVLAVIAALLCLRVNRSDA
jgi:EmrB/QacA subfamily drug resistance transporter